MVLENSLVISLLALILLLVIAGIVVVLRKMPGNSAGENPAVLQERLNAREAEKNRLASELATIRRELEQEKETVSGLREKLGRQETQLLEERNQSKEKLQLLQNAKEQMSHEFRNLANEILEQKGKSFTESNRENIENILKPLKQKIHDFEKRVEASYDKEAKERFSLTAQIKQLQELNTKISEDAINLTNALKGENKTQGNWGEVILERVLEKSGLTKGREYEIQVSIRNEQGRNRQPDVIVHLPENKDVIIDAKVSLNAYEKYCSDTDDSSRQLALRQHIQSIRSHIKGLSDKDYHNLEEVRSLDFVMLFLPVEGAFTVAVQQDNSLFTEAFEKNVMLVGPSTLLATLRIIQNIWRYENQNKHALEIASRAGRLYDKFVSFTENLTEVGRRLDQTQDAYESAFKQLSSGRGNLVTHVEKLKQLGARASKQLPEQLLDDSATLDELENNEQQD